MGYHLHWSRRIQGGSNGFHLNRHESDRVSDEVEQFGAIAVPMGLRSLSAASKSSTCTLRNYLLDARFRKRLNVHLSLS